MRISRRLIAALAVATAGLALTAWRGPSAGHAGGSGAAVSNKDRHAATAEQDDAGVTTPKEAKRQAAAAQGRQTRAEPGAPADDQGDRLAPSAAALAERGRRAMAIQQVQQALQTLREVEVRKAEFGLARAQARYERAVQLKETGEISAVDLQQHRSDLERALLEVERAKAEAALKGPAEAGVVRSAQDTLRELKVRAVELDLEDARQQYKALREMNKKGDVSSEQFLAAKQAVERAALEVERAKAMATLERLNFGKAANGVANANGTLSPSLLPPVSKEALCYDGKTFDQWCTEWRTELMPERRTKAILAFKTFAAHGYAREAAQAIVEVMRNYDTHLIDNSPEGRLKKAAIDSFQSIDPQHAVAVLIHELEAGNVNGRLLAVRVLQQFGGRAEAALPALVERIQDEDWRVQRAAIYAVAQMDRVAEGFLPALRKVLKDEDAAVVQAAIDALVPRRLGFGRAYEWTPWGRTRPPTNAALAGDGRRGEGRHTPSGTYVPELVESLRHADAAIRSRALEALQTLGPQAKDAVPALITELRTEREPDKLYLVCTILGSIGPAASEAAPVLKEIGKETEDAELRQAVNAVLRAITLPTDAALEDGSSRLDSEEVFGGREFGNEVDEGFGGEP